MTFIVTMTAFSSAHENCTGVEPDTARKVVYCVGRLPFNNMGNCEGGIGQSISGLQLPKRANLGASPRIQFPPMSPAQSSLPIIVHLVTHMDPLYNNRGGALSRACCRDASRQNCLVGGAQRWEAPLNCQRKSETRNTSIYLECIPIVTRE